MWVDTKEDAWNGIEFLASVDGSLERFPPFRVLHLASRLDATGQLRIETEGEPALLGISRGKLVQVDGVPGLLHALDGQLPDHRQLLRDLGMAVAAGHAYDRAAEVASESLGVWLARLLTRTDGDVVFESRWSPPPRSFPIPTPISRLLSLGLRAARSETDLARFWTPRLEGGLQVTPPEDSAEERWGLEAASLRMLKLAPRAKSPGILVDLATGSEPARRGESLRSLDLLYWLGMLQVSEARSAPQLEQRAVENRPSRPALPPLSPEEAARFEKALAFFKTAHPVEILELTGKKSVTDVDVDAAFREISRRFHPDLFPSAGELAEQCFEALNGAHEALKAPNGIADANRYLEAKANGTQYISDKDHLAARVACKKGELALRNREWAAAAAHMEEAWRLDPVTWPHAFLRTQARYLTRQISLPELQKDLDTIATQLDPGPRDPNRPADRPYPTAIHQRYQRRAEVLVTIANFLKLDGREKDSRPYFEKALAADPENRDAQREMRRAEKQSAEAADANWLGKLFTKKS